MTAIIEARVGHEALIECLNRMATESLNLWDVPADAKATLINVSENATYLVESASGYRSVLRIHRDGYHSYNAIASELAWSGSLKKSGKIQTPAAIMGRNGEAIQQSRVAGPSGKRYMVLFEHVGGVEPLESDDLTAPFESLGEIAARTHAHSRQWVRPEYFERMSWNLDAVFGSHPTWGNWRDAPEMTEAYERVLAETERVVTLRLSHFGQGDERYGLIHADMRLANLLIDGCTTQLIDFDDCGSGWYLYDFAAAISFMEEHPQVPALKTAWVKGYRKVLDLPDEDEHEIETFIMLRRIALCAWMSTHPEVAIVRQLSPTFVSNTVQLAESYLVDFG